MCNILSVVSPVAHFTILRRFYIAFGGYFESRLFLFQEPFLHPDTLYSKHRVPQYLYYIHFQSCDGGSVKNQRWFLVGPGPGPDSTQGHLRELPGRPGAAHRTRPGCGRTLFARQSWHCQRDTSRRCKKSDFREQMHILLSSDWLAASVADPDLGSGIRWLFDPWIRDPEWIKKIKIRIRDEHLEWYFQFLG